MKFILLAFLLFTTLPALARMQNDQDSVVLIEEEVAGGEKRKPNFIAKSKPGAGIDSLQLRVVPPTVIESFRNDKAYHYPSRNVPSPGAPDSQPQEKKQTSKPYEPAKSRSGFQNFLWIFIIGGFLAFLVIWLSSSNIHLFRKSSKVSLPESEVEEQEDIFAINYQRDIDKAARSGNYRLAIRLLYLRVLKSMAERNIIRYRQDSTNLDYLLQLSTTKYYEDFFKVTRSYEYSWYGHFEVREDAYHIIRNDFERLSNKLH